MKRRKASTFALGLFRFLIKEKHFLCWSIQLQWAQTCTLSQRHITRHIPALKQYLTTNLHLTSLQLFTSLKCFMKNLKQLIWISLPFIAVVVASTVAAFPVLCESSRIAQERARASRKREEEEDTVFLASIRHTCDFFPHFVSVHYCSFLCSLSSLVEL